MGHGKVPLAFCVAGYGRCGGERCVPWTPTHLSLTPTWTEVGTEFFKTPSVSLRRCHFRTSGIFPPSTGKTVLVTGVRGLLGSVPRSRPEDPLLGATGVATPVIPLQL